MSNLNGLLNTMVPDTVFLNFEKKITASTPARIKHSKAVAKRIRKKKPVQIVADSVLAKRLLDAKNARNANEKRIVESRSYNRRKYKTKVVDYCELVTIRINAKTIIYSKPGEEAITKANFLKNYSKSLSQKDQNQ